MRAPAPALRRRDLLALGGALALSAIGPPARAESARIVYFAGLGPQPSRHALDVARDGVQALFGFTVRELPVHALPRSAFYAPRQRYRAEKLLAHLTPELPPEGHRIVGVTTADISTTKEPHADWGILGLADIGGAACVVSSFRCARGARDAAHAAERFGKVVAHELGHTLGLPHCRATRGCLMEDAGGSVLTTDIEFDLCPSCRQRLQRAGYTLRSDGQLPWHG